MRWVALLAAVGCARGADEAGATPSARPETPTRRTFPVIPAPERPAVATKIAKQFPASWHAKVEVDAFGFPKEVTLELPDAPVAPTDPAASPTPAQIERALAIVRDHAAVFGIVGERPLHHVIDTQMTRIYAGDRWTGQVVARFTGATLVLYDHLWPIATEAVAIRPDIEKLVAPLYGVKGEFPSRCKRDCGSHDHRFTVDKRSFSFVGQMALVCTPEGLVARPAVAIQTHWRSGSRVPGSERLSPFVDPKTHAPIVASHVYMPGDGHLVDGAPKVESRVGIDFVGCFK